MIFLNALKEFNPQLTLDYCYELIKLNRKNDFRLPYLELMEQILEKHNVNKIELAAIKHDLFVIDPNFERYLFVMRYLDDKKYLLEFRNETLNYFQDLSYEDDSNRYKILVLQILDNEKNYKKMAHFVENYSMPYSILKPFLNELVAIDKISVLYGLSRDYMNLYFGDLLKDGVPQDQEVCCFIKEHFTEDEVISELNLFWNSSFKFYPENVKEGLFNFFDVKFN